MGRYDRYNRNGTELCHYVGCRKHAHLIEIFGGKFCKIHRRAIREIRSKKVGAHYNDMDPPDLITELGFRQDEYCVRKFDDRDHLVYLIGVYRRIMSHGVMYPPRY